MYNRVCKQVHFIHRYPKRLNLILSFDVVAFALYNYEFFIHRISWPMLYEKQQNKKQTNNLKIL